MRDASIECKYVDGKFASWEKEWFASCFFEVFGKYQGNSKSLCNEKSSFVVFYSVFFVLLPVLSVYVTCCCCASCKPDSNIAN